MKHALFTATKTLWHLFPLSFRRSAPTLWLAKKTKGMLSKNVLNEADLSPKIEERPVTIVEPILTNESEVKPPLLATMTPGVRVISTLDELDEMLKMLDQAAAISDDELRRGFTKFQMQFPLDLPEDPDSDEYRATQMKLYQWLNGKVYTTANEVSAFDVAAAIKKPFPFQTESPQTVGNHIISIGHLIRTLNLKAKSSLLEFGPGWGNTTIWLARMGYAVTAVDIEQNFIDLINGRAKAKGLEVEAIQGDFSLIDSFDRQFDAVLFFECFHHCSNHQALIASLDRVVTPGGKVLFAAEPILDAFPIPWGLRLDGESLWAIRHQGWLELGFQETYFRGLMARHGWDINKVECTETPWGTIFVATRKVEAQN